MLLSLVTMAEKVKHYTEIFLLMLFKKIFCVFFFLSLDELHLKEGGPPTLNHPASQQGGGEEEKIPGRRSLGGMEECRVWGDPF